MSTTTTRIAQISFAAVRCARIRYSLVGECVSTRSAGCVALFENTLFVHVHVAEILRRSANILS